MGILVLRRGLGFCRSAAGLLKCRTICSSSGRISEKGATSSPSPWLMMPSVSDSDESGKVAFKFHRLGNKEPFTISRDKFELDQVYFAGSSHGWLFVHNSMNRDFFLLDPISGRRIKLPPVHAEGGVIRAALDEECRRAMIIFGGEARRLAFCVPGSSAEWIPIGGERKYDDVVYSSTHGVFFCITWKYEPVPKAEGLKKITFKFTVREYTSQVEMWNVREPMCPRIDWRLRGNEHLLRFDYPDYPWPSRSFDQWEVKQVSCHIKYVLVHGHDLFLVVRHVHPPSNLLHDDDHRPDYFSPFKDHPYKTFDFDAYKVDWRGSGEMRYMKASLEGLAIFVGNNHSFAMLVSESDDDLKPNCIYYSDDRSVSFPETVFQGGHDNGIFNYQNDAFVECCHGCLLNPVHYHHIKWIQPPPLWLV